MEKIKLRNGFEVSVIGFGTHPLKAHQIFRTIPKLSSFGVSLVDTAHDYKNENLIGIVGKFSPTPLIYSIKMSVKQQKSRNSGGIQEKYFYRALNI